MIPSNPVPPRTLKDYRPQHDAGCGSGNCAECNRLIHQAIPDMAGTEPRPVLPPHNPGSVDVWDCECLECQISSRVESFPWIATPSARMDALRSIVALDIWPIDVSCTSAQEHEALRTITKILPALLRDLEYYQKIGSAPVPLSEALGSAGRSAAQENAAQEQAETREAEAFKAGWDACEDSPGGGDYEEAVVKALAAYRQSQGAPQ